MTSSRMLSVVAGISLVYDLAAGLMLLAATGRMASYLGIGLDPIIFAKLNGLFLIAVGLGYAPAVRAPQAHRPYLWIFGVFLKGAGAIAFLADVYVNRSPSMFLGFAASDGLLAILTLAALLLPFSD